LACMTNRLRLLCCFLPGKIGLILRRIKDCKGLIRNYLGTCIEGTLVPRFPHGLKTLIPKVWASAAISACNGYFVLLISEESVAWRLSQARRHRSLFSPMLFASVIPTGAPREFCPFKKSPARSGGIPTEFPPPCRFRAFFPDCQWQQPIAKGTLFSTYEASDSLLPNPACHEGQR
jgi:hypothetical protein